MDAVESWLREITGPLDVQLRDACKFVERNMRVYAIKASNRIEIPQFSINAVFEAVVNAVAHRDYAIYGSKIRLHVFSDRLEIYSPGTIPSTVTIDSLTERQSTRNELLSTLLARCPMKRQSSNSILSQWYRALQNNKTVFNMPGGEILRDYLPVEKIAEYIVRIALQNDVTSVINCCSGIPISVRRIVDCSLFRFHAHP